MVKVCGRLGDYNLGILILWRCKTEFYIFRGWDFVHTRLLVVAKGRVPQREATQLLFLCLLPSFYLCFLVSFLPQRGFLPFLLTFPLRDKLKKYHFAYRRDCKLTFSLLGVNCDLFPTPVKFLRQNIRMQYTTMMHLCVLVTARVTIFCNIISHQEENKF